MLWVCVTCTARYAPGLSCCPQCGGTTYREAPGGVAADDAPVLDSAPVPGAAEPAGKPAKPPKDVPAAGAGAAQE